MKYITESTLTVHKLPVASPGFGARRCANLNLRESKGLRGHLTPHPPKIEKYF